MPVPRRARAEPRTAQPAWMFWTLVAVVALAPLPFGANHPWSWSLLALAVAVLLVGAGAVACVTGRGDPGGWARLAWAMAAFAAFAAWSLLQAATGMPAAWTDPMWRETAEAIGRPLAPRIGLDPENTITTLMRLATYGGVLLLASELGRRRNRVNGALWVLALAGLAYAVYGLVEQFAATGRILGIAKWAYPLDLTSTFVNRNHYGAYAGLGLLVVATLLAGEFGRASAGARGRHPITVLDRLSWRAFALLGAAAVIAAALAWTRSRGAMVATGLALPVLVAALLWGGQLRLRLAAALAVLMATAAAVVPLAAPTLTLGRYLDVAADIDGRSALNAVSVRAIVDRPLLGTGLGSYPAAFLRHRGADFGDDPRRYIQAHNSYLELAMESGVPAALALLAILAVLVAILLRSLPGASSPGPALGLAATTLVGVHSAIDFSLQIPAVAATWCLLLGLALARASPIPAARDARGGARRRRPGGSDPPEPGTDRSVAEEGAVEARQ